MSKYCKYCEELVEDCTCGGAVLDNGLDIEELDDDFEEEDEVDDDVLCEECGIRFSNCKCWAGDDLDAEFEDDDDEDDEDDCWDE